jgi:hypothetical protein
LFDRWNKFRRAQRQVARDTNSGELLARIEALTREHRAAPNRDREHEIMRLRQLAGIALVEEAGARPDLVEPAPDGLPDANVPEVSAAELTPGLIRAAILEHGAILVRGLVDAETAAHLAGEIDRAFAARETVPHGVLFDETDYYHEFSPEPYHDMITERHHVRSGGGILAADTPRVAASMIEVFEQADLRDLIGGYLREPPLFSAHKTTLRKADPSIPGSWHQDGKFLGDVRALNLWLSLSHCGDTAPGLDLVPRRLEKIVEAGAGDEGFLKIVVSQETAEELAGEAGIQRPIFEPGDAMFFDHLYLHQTASEPEMPNPRFAVESWFFGPSAFPEGYIPLAY